MVYTGNSKPSGMQYGTSVAILVVLIVLCLGVGIWIGRNDCPAPESMGLSMAEIEASSGSDVSSETPINEEPSVPIFTMVEPLTKEEVEKLMANRVLNPRILPVREEQTIYMPMVIVDGDIIRTQAVCDAVIGGTMTEINTEGDRMLVQYAQPPFKQGDEVSIYGCSSNSVFFIDQ